MNETMNTILARRSYKSYQSEQLKEEELQTILEAGKYAPSGANRQPWLFTVVQRKDLLEKLNEECKKNFAPPVNFPTPPNGMPPPLKKDHFYGAPTLIIISAVNNFFTVSIDCVHALSNMFIAAESLNIGATWSTGIVKDIFPQQDSNMDLKKELEIPEDHTVYAAAVFGYKGDEPKPRSPRKEGTVNILK